ncbi:Outer membrane protein beta-barrel domain-containing protein [Paenimyroides ummariense]|uniref:Outer membrane protein beta-barrel domain-containing protein n=1 Tax=Paenimyroides ummariense TaxID=913024 RepID=A0A1I5EYB6_9FLAO|nr:porin family protein [Paenimyroides ummariense]SFO16484.1 Outer membrane protein beta-barrel domain-containing protein [Paenimyroides ummariense]
MKKLIFTGLLLVITTLTVKAQSIELIPKAGINLSNQKIEHFNGEKNKLNFQGGLGVNIPTGIKNFSIQPEINFVGKGTKFKYLNHSSEINLNYLEAPVLAKYSYGVGYVNAGPAVGFLIDKDSKIPNYAGKLNRVEFSIHMGAGVAIPLGPGKVIVDGRYVLGLNSLSKSTEIKNTGIIISAGYAFAL